MKQFQFCGTCGDNNISAVSNIIVEKYSDMEISCLQILQRFIGGVIKGDINLHLIINNMSIQGIFLKLCDPKQYSDLVFPGSPDYVLSLLPKNLKELLLWKDIELDLIKVARKAESVLDGVKNKGRRRGEDMDDQTEAILLPQVVYEALAIELVDCVRTLGRQLSAIRAQVSVKEASPTATQASFNQLEDDVIDDLISKKICVQEEYMGKEWADVITKDLLRFVKHEKMSEKILAFTEEETKLSPLTAFIEYEDIKHKYPALTELVQQLHALPFEINRKYIMNCDI
jgi:hypothetical protein